MNIYSQTVIINAIKSSQMNILTTFLKSTTRSDTIKYRYKIKLPIKN